MRTRGKLFLIISCPFCLHQCLFVSKYSCNTIILSISAKSSLISFIMNIVTSVVYGTSTPKGGSFVRDKFEKSNARLLVDLSVSNRS